MLEEDYDTIMGGWAPHDARPRLTAGAAGADVNVKGVWLTVKACAREMIRRNKGGRVVLMSSANSVIASKAACAPAALPAPGVLSRQSFIDAVSQG